MGLAWIQWGVLLGVFLTAVGAGCATRKADLEHAQELSGAVAVCLFVQYLVRPLIGFALCAAFDVPDLVAIGVLLCCCAPGGSGASLHLMLTGGDTALGSACTTISSVASLGGVPLVFALYFQRFAESGFATPWDDIFLVIAIVVVGVLAGVGVRRHYERAGRQLEEASSAVGSAILIALLSVSFFDNVSIFSDIPSSALFVGATVAPCCVFFGSATNRIAGLDPRAARTIAIETAECNVGFAYAIMLLAWRCAPADRGERTDACEAGDAVFTGVISFTIFNQIAIWVLTAGWLMDDHTGFSSFVERRRSSSMRMLQNLALNGSVTSTCSDSGTPRTDHDLDGDFDASLFDKGASKPGAEDIESEPEHVSAGNGASDAGDRPGNGGAVFVYEEPGNDRRDDSASGCFSLNCADGSDCNGTRAAAGTADGGDGSDPEVVVESGGLSNCFAA